MRSPVTLLVLIVLGLGLRPLGAQVQSLSTTQITNNAQAGVMFDITSSQGAIIRSIDVMMNPLYTSSDFEIYTRVGSHVGFEQSPGDWTLVGTATGVAGLSGAPTPIPIPIHESIHPGTRRSFYVTMTAGTGVQYYSGGGPVGTPIVSDANLEILVGTGNTYSFGPTFSPREFRGTVHYSDLPHEHLATTFNSNNGNAGNMFDVQSHTNVVVRRLDLNLDPGSWDIQLYSRLGSHGGVEQSPLAWSHVGSYPGLVSNGTDSPTHLPLDIDLPILAGETRAFYVFTSNGNGMNYTSAVGAAGAIYASNSDIDILVGTGNGANFNSTFSPRGWNGRVYYDVCPSNVPYQMNSQKASLDHNGIHPTGCEPAIATVVPGDVVTAHVQTNLTGAPYEVVLAFAPQVPRGHPDALELGNSQVLNVPVTHPSFTFLWGGGFPNFQPGASWALPFIAPPGPVSWSAQSIYLDFSSPGGLTVSAAATIDIVPHRILVEAVGASSFNSDTTSGFWRITNQGGGEINGLTLDLAASTVLAQANMHFDVDQVGMLDLFAGGNSTLPGCSGTYRNGSDQTCGLVYTGTDLSPCDPNANSGFIGSNPGLSTYVFGTLDFNFDGSFTLGKTFEFDCDTDGGTGIGSSGGAMAGIHVTVFIDNDSYTGILQLDPQDPQRSFVILN